MSAQQYRGADRLIIEFDRMLQTVAGVMRGNRRPCPSAAIAEADLTPAEREHAAALMRVNHVGEVCAQALYQGQALTANQQSVRGGMEQAAREELDHLAWCEARVTELGEQTSVLNPLFYSLSFGLGALAGALGDRLSLGFVAATEEQVCHHLRSHLTQLPEDDDKSRAIVEQMLSDESRHATHALESGGEDFPPAAKHLMALVSRVMTASTYRL